MPGDQTSLQRSFYEINTQVPRRALVAWWSGPLGWIPSAPRGPALLFTHQLTLTTERASTPTPLESVLKSPHRDPHEDPVLPMRGQVPPGPLPIYSTPSWEVRSWWEARQQEEKAGKWRFAGKPGRRLTGPGTLTPGFSRAASGPPLLPSHRPTTLL